MKVLVVANLYPTLGDHRGSFVHSQVRSAVAAGADVRVLHVDLRKMGSGAMVAREATVDGIKIAYRPVRAFPRFQRVRCGQTLKVVRKWIRSGVGQDWRPDIVHAHGSVFAAVAARTIASAWNTPWLLTEHSDWVRSGASSYVRKLVADVYRSADTRVAVSAALAETMQVLAPGVEVDVIPNVVDVGEIPAAKGAQRTMLHFLAVGNLVKPKGFDLLIDAFVASEAYGYSRLDIVGGGPEFDNLQKRIHNAGMEEHICLKGVLPRTMLLSMYAEYDGLISASHRETFGVAIAEALAAGLPVLSTRSGGPEAMVVDRGLLCEASVEGLKRGFREFADAIRARRWDRQAISLYAADYFSPDVVGKVYLDLYAKIAGRKHG